MCCDLVCLRLRLLPLYHSIFILWSMFLARFRESLGRPSADVKKAAIRAHGQMIIPGSGTKCPGLHLLFPPEFVCRSSVTREQHGA